MWLICFADFCVQEYCFHEYYSFSFFVLLSAKDSLLIMINSISCFQFSSTSLELQNKLLNIYETQNDKFTNAKKKKIKVQNIPGILPIDLYLDEDEDEDEYLLQTRCEMVQLFFFLFCCFVFFVFIRLKNIVKFLVLFFCKNCLFFQFFTQQRIFKSFNCCSFFQ